MSLESELIINASLLSLLILFALGVLLARNLFSAILMSGALSITMASLFVLLAAPDVAFTEAAVGAGLSAILALATMMVLRPEEKKQAAFQPVSLFTILATGAIIFYGTLDLESHKSPQSAPHLHVAPYYLSQSLKDTQVPNVVTAVLASYRGFDTLGEVFVIFTAGIGVLALLGMAVREKKP